MDEQDSRSRQVHIRSMVKPGDVETNQNRHANHFKSGGEGWDPLWEKNSEHT